MLNLELLNKDSVTRLWEDYTRNYVVQLFGVEQMEEKVSNCYKWFEEKGYANPDEKPLKDEDFNEIAEKEWTESEKVKTEYVIHYEDLITLKAQKTKLEDWLKDCEAILPRIKDLVDNIK